MSHQNISATFRPRSRTGFTLVELLVVVGVIALLIGFLLPALNKARESARKAKCLSNLRQLAMAATQYANDNHGVFPLECGNLLARWDIHPGTFRRDMYVNMGFRDPEPTSIAYNNTGTSATAAPAVSDAWMCPSNPTFYISLAWSNSGTPRLVAEHRLLLRLLRGRLGDGQDRRHLVSDRDRQQSAL